MDTFTQDKEEMLDRTEALFFKENITSYNDAMGSVLNDHAPLEMKKIKKAPNAAWFDCEYE